MTIVSIYVARIHVPRTSEGSIPLGRPEKFLWFPKLWWRVPAGE